MATVVENLKAARAKIADPADWIQCHYAKNNTGDSICGDEPGATCFCSAGAIQAVRNTACEEETREYEILKEVAIELGSPGVPSYNDSHSHAEVMAMWDKAIARAEELAV